MGAPPSNSGDSITQRRSQRVMLRGPGARHRQEAGLRRNANRHCERTRRDDSSDGKSVGRAIAHASELKKWRRRAVSSGLRQPSPWGEVGVDFMKPCLRFWRISFPPADWTNRAPEAKGNTSRYSGTPTGTKKAK